VFVYMEIVEVISLRKTSLFVSLLKRKSFLLRLLLLLLCVFCGLFDLKNLLHYFPTHTHIFLLLFPHKLCDLLRLLEKDRKRPRVKIKHTKKEYRSVSQAKLLSTKEGGGIKHIEIYEYYCCCCLSLLNHYYDRCRSKCKKLP
jgi:hypothetical protein